MNIVSKTVEGEVEEIVELMEDATTALLITKMNEVIRHLNSTPTNKGRDRGPKSTRDMSDEDAWRVKFGDLRNMKHKAAATELKLSYGQVYSARGNYTFTHIVEDSFHMED